ncbi:4-(cytidine 5'-diphospho)-2-C-methyl-D-erythritol kinase [Candidatus Bipolaricaulota bacterium]|nr:4-(cytidine 5'-diphospho)-2-C-methyl-D-erythritol kinase [Candidatus Bipolaricaulota bacterium]
MTVHVLAYAKLNLFLDVLSVRPDGFHEIKSLVQTIDLADRIEITPSTTISVSCSVLLAGANIAETATRKLLQEKKSRTGIDIRIDKHIPIGAGLGGGSSDAAAVLAVVNQMVPPRISDARMAAIAESIGADVPLFLNGGCVSLRGLGSPEETHPVRSETFVLLVPKIHCSTEDVYKGWRSDDVAGLESELGRNSLAPAALRLHPELQTAAHAVGKLGGDYAGMTGSGSAHFAAFSDPMQARSAYEELTRQQRDSRVYYCHPTRAGFAVSQASGFHKQGV